MRWINRISALTALFMMSTARSTDPGPTSPAPLHISPRSSGPGSAAPIALMSNAPRIEAAAPRYHAPHPALLSPRQRRKLAPGRDVLSRRRVR
jgi:hypothetical protein